MSKESACATSRHDVDLWQRSDAVSAHDLRAFDARASRSTGYSQDRAFVATLDTPNMRAYEPRAVSGGVWPESIRREMGAPDSLEDTAKPAFLQTQVRARGYRI
jgi:hypothetical protein